MNHHNKCFQKQNSEQFQKSHFTKFMLVTTTAHFRWALAIPLDTECVDLDLIEIEMPEMEQNDQECLDPDAY